jgi:hypothetical protein
MEDCSHFADSVQYLMDRIVVFVHILYITA